jgi:hypothetical protein
MNSPVEVNVRRDLETGCVAIWMGTRSIWHIDGGPHPEDVPPDNVIVFHTDSDCECDFHYQTEF